MKQKPLNTLCNSEHKIKHSWIPNNENEEKEKFLKYRQIPNFTYDNSVSINKYYTAKKMGYIHFDLFYEARWILNKISSIFGSFDQFITSSFGKILSIEQIKRRVEKYLDERKLSDVISISYVKNISCSAKLNSMGFSRSLNRPEVRKYSLLINVRKENIFLREFGIECLLDHEISTHFIRAFNEGLQPWYWNRIRFGLSSTAGYENKQIEEGLATINTILAAKEKFLGTSALLYYATCMANFLPFGQLFDHLARYIEDPDIRWRHCVRIKRSLRNVNEIGGYAKDQCYFEGAVYLLANVHHINFTLLCSGKVTVKDLTRIHKVARLNACQVPSFMADIDKYKKELISIAKHNNIYIMPHQPVKTIDDKSLKLPPLTKVDNSKELMRIKTYLKWKKPNHKYMNHKQEIPEINKDINNKDKSDENNDDNLEKVIFPNHNKDRNE